MNNLFLCILDASAIYFSRQKLFPATIQVIFLKIGNNLPLRLEVRLQTSEIQSQDKKSQFVASTLTF
jgi:hypothetical protein